MLLHQPKRFVGLLALLLEIFETLNNITKLDNIIHEWAGQNIRFQTNDHHQT